MLAGKCFGEESTCQCKRCVFNPSVRKIAPERKWQPASVLASEITHARTRARARTHTRTRQRWEVCLGWRLERNGLSPAPFAELSLTSPPHSGILGDLTVDVSSYMKDLFSATWPVFLSQKFPWEPPSGLECCEGRNRSRGQTGQWGKLMIRFQWGQFITGGHHVCIKGRDRWNCWGGKVQLPAQDHFLLVEAVKLWLWPSSLIWRPSAF